MKKLLSLSFALTFALVTACTTPTQTTDKKEEAKEVHFTYEGEEGPEHWGDLSADFKLCKEGKTQTPVDIVTKDVKGEKIEAPAFTYKESALKILNNGHTVQANYEPGSSVKVNGKEFKLLQFHFHAPSEHKIDGKASEMELHLVHKSDDGELAVVGLMINKGKSNDNLKGVFANLPAKEQEEKAVDAVKVDANNFLPSEKAFYNYSGSLTTPPCSEKVNWYLMKTPVEASEEQISAFTKIFALNARPVQPLNERVIKTLN